jgi:circadian clock protein KaiB
MTRLRMRLFVAGGSPNSMRALANLRAMLARHEGEFDLEVVDILESPERAVAEDILVTPTLLKLTPSPIRQIIGSLSDRPRVLDVLGMGDPTLAVRAL